ncbi:hypothetical protein [Mesorhizobium erdmanii]|uniref:Uncharacterized protein n=1 Tax=Mesorhizobium erdmanii TaxID=1777866 RepID=A0A6M7UEY0_9HYPH|nr:MULTISPECIES: hypothetical protein [Mesorhizobium]OBQ59309.1 hypothetical protein A8146_20660 [Mesorhizobium loti]QKC75781.1 hypothetical protein EB233_09675 [Mesorhizobium erdmanii]
MAPSLQELRQIRKLGWFGVSVETMNRCVARKDRIAARLAISTLFQKVKIPREFCFGPCQIAREREGNTLLADVACLPQNRAGRRGVT